MYQNIDVMHSHRPKHVLVLAGDHIYKMDYGPMIAYHVEKGADITVGVVEVPIVEAKEFGVLTVTEWNRVTRFVEKSPTPIPCRAAPTSRWRRWASTCSTRSCSRSCSSRTPRTRSPSTISARTSFPKAIEKLQVFAYPFRDVKTRAQSYWRDVGTIDAFYEANLELVWVASRAQHLRRGLADLDLPGADAAGEVRARRRRPPRHRHQLAGVRRRIISGATVRESLLFSGVRVEERSMVERSVILPDVRIGQNCQVRNAIIDAGCEIAGGTRIGFDRAEDAKRFLVTEKGVVLVTPDMLSHA